MATARAWMGRVEGVCVCINDQLQPAREAGRVQARVLTGVSVNEGMAVGNLNSFISFREGGSWYTVMVRRQLRFPPFTVWTQRIEPKSPDSVASTFALRKALTAGLPEVRDVTKTRPIGGGRLRSVHSPGR